MLIRRGGRLPGDVRVYDFMGDTRVWAVISRPSEFRVCLMGQHAVFKASRADDLAALLAAIAAGE